METTIYLTELHAEHGKWIELMSFFDDEIQSFNNRLSEVLKANTSIEIRAHAEHFQNQFIRQKEVLDILKHDIKLSESELQAKISFSPVATDRKRMLDEPLLRDQVETYSKLFTELKEDFKKFLITTL